MLNELRHFVAIPAPRTLGLSQDGALLFSSHRHCTFRNVGLQIKIYAWPFDSVSPYPLRQLFFIFEKNAESDNFISAPVSRSPPARTRPRPASRGSHRHRHIVGLRRASAVRFARQFPVIDDEEAPHQIDYLRIALVSARRHQHSLPQRTRRDHLGRMGR